MSFKFTALVVTFFASITMSGFANALTNNEMFLVAYDAAAQKTFIAALGQAGNVSSFTGSSNIAIDYSADANWTNFISGAFTGGIRYQVLGFYQSNPAAPTSYNANDKLLVSSNALPGNLANGQMDALMAEEAISSGVIAQFESLNSTITGTSTGLVIGGGFDSGVIVGVGNVFNQYKSIDTTAFLGTDLGFYSITRPVTSSRVAQTVKSQFRQDPSNRAGDTWNLSATGQLTYAVPEAETSAMMLMGLGIMGFMVKRRKK
ncbi:PEP-CTERM sorting domain-containing protein [Methylotenera sp.]|uniref:PEP-CTERM sorting domain-containing protein n=1 Tax=Methylotenera sp. TaxID=2051956 RepID=UPI00248915EE|nr:PEP-CTERM sorting domain-containing protein [Methylotenera sp.]MDI1361803.1 PEP-CTERM sorting domain-containing protein [Methylotenera sp.]